MFLSEVLLIETFPGMSILERMVNESCSCSWISTLPMESEFGGGIGGGGINEETVETRGEVNRWQEVFWWELTPGGAISRVRCTGDI
jgi:hypothetical protein